MRRLTLVSCLFVWGSMFSAFANEKPNILWLTSEDNNVNWVGCYGNPHADTPNIDRLATQGFQYMHCYANAPVCAPSRSTWITGVHALSMGTHPMRSRYEIPHDRILYYPDLLKARGYYTVNQRKTDYNIGGRKDSSAWDAGKVDWPVLEAKQPFFAVLNHTSSHESRAFGAVDKTTHKPADTRLAAYHPDLPVIRQNYAHYHDAVKKMDDQIGRALQALTAQGLEDSTIVIYNSDHGGVLARSKRFLYNSGTHCPFIIRIPERFKHLWPAEKPGAKVDRLVSFIDMTRTWMSLAGVQDVGVMQGQVILGKEADPEREWHVSYRARMDERVDNQQASRNKQYLYIRNYMPYAPAGQHLSYLWRMEATRAWAAHHKEGKTDAVTGRWFGTKEVEELYDTTKDPDNVVNLAGTPETEKVLVEMRAQLRAWQVRHHDAALLPESEMVERAKAHNVTQFDLVRNPDQYDLEGYLDASEIALSAVAADLPKLLNMLEHADSGIRYWGMVGVFLLKDASKGELNRVRNVAKGDESDHVRVMAAYALNQFGETEEAQATFNDLLKSGSHATLKILNIIDWIGGDRSVYRDGFLAAKSAGSYPQRMVDYFGGLGKTQDSTKKNKK